MREGKVETRRPVLRAWEDSGRASTTRPPPGTTAASAAATHLVKASPRSITTAVFSPPLPRPSYRGMVVRRTVPRRAQPQDRPAPALGGAGPKRQCAGVATAGTSSGRGAPGPGCPGLCLTPRRIQILQSISVSGTKLEETRAAADRGEG